MPTEFVSGDLFRHPGLDALAHGCNCAGAMGKGIAVAFKRRFPDMYAEYRSRCKRGAFALGDVFYWTDGSARVFNLGTQRTWRSGATFAAVETALTRMVTMAPTVAVRRIGLPRVGAGLGGLAWADVRRLLQRLGAAHDVDLVVFETYSERAAGCS